MENSEANEMAVKLFRVVFIGAALFILSNRVGFFSSWLQ